MSEPPVVFREAWPVARKAHVCCECRGTIQPGERYRKAEGVWDGRGATYKQCHDCAEMFAEVDAGLPCWEGVCFGELADHAFEDAELTRRFVGTMRRRGAEIAPSVLRLEAETNKP